MMRKTGVYQNGGFLGHQNANNWLLLGYTTGLENNLNTLVTEIIESFDQEKILKKL